IRARICSLGRGLSIGQLNRAPIRIEAFRPGLVNEVLAQKKLSVCAIEHVEKPIPIGDHHDLASNAVELDIGKYRSVCGIPIMRVVWSELKVPAQLAGVGIQSE